MIIPAPDRPTMPYLWAQHNIISKGLYTTHPKNAVYYTLYDIMTPSRATRIGARATRIGAGYTYFGVSRYNVLSPPPLPSPRICSTYRVRARTHTHTYIYHYTLTIHYTLLQTLSLLLFTATLHYSLLLCFLFFVVVSLSLFFWYIEI